MPEGVRMSRVRVTQSAYGSEIEVDGSPVLLLGGQFHNSSMSSTSHIHKYFAKVTELGYNFAIGSASWMLVEPVEGQFDFSLVQEQLTVARQHGLRLALIWFGAFKNAASTYAPTWVRADQKRFPRALWAGASDTNATPVLTAFSESLLEADKRAFTELMSFLAKEDQHNTVILVQVENEVGLLGDSIDRCPEAQAIWRSHVPESVLTALKDEALDSNVIDLWKVQGSRQSGSWEEVFGTSWQSHEIFMAWQFASYCNELAIAGKTLHDVPMYANAWLGPQTGQTQAGQWPSGGPSENVISIWRAFARALDFVSPDIYVPDAVPEMRTYARKDNPLFIPESRHNAGNLFASIQIGALGYSVFGAEDGRVGNQLSAAYSLLIGMEQTLIRARREGRIQFALLSRDELKCDLEFGNLSISCSNSLLKLRKFVEVAGVDLHIQDPEAPSELENLTVSIPSPFDLRAFALVVQESESQYLMVGKGINPSFSVDGKAVEIDSMVEGRFKSDKWIPGRNLNGDERLNPLPLNELSAVRINLLKPLV